MSQAEYKQADVRAQLSNHFKATPAGEQGAKWNELYAGGFIPWDKGRSNPALEDLLESGQDLLGNSLVDGEKRRKRALVPGCGIGYDVLLLSAFGYDAYGLEVSEIALENAKKYETEKAGTVDYSARSIVGKGKVQWLIGDFFKDEFAKGVNGDGTFDLIYDYTFLSALPPSLRPAWSLRMSQLLAPGGRLVCVEYPTYKPHNTGGPPWALPPKVYFGHLSRPGRELPYDEDQGLLEEKLGTPADDGLHRLAHFQPKRTHDAGMLDGKITDWVSIWIHEAVE